MAGATYTGTVSINYAIWDNSEENDVFGYKDIYCIHQKEDLI